MKKKIRNNSIKLTKDGYYNIEILVTHPVTVIYKTRNAFPLVEVRKGQSFDGQYEITTAGAKPKHCFFIFGIEDYVYFDIDKIKYRRI